MNARDLMAALLMIAPTIALVVAIAITLIPAAHPAAPATTPYAAKAG